MIRANEKKETTQTAPSPAEEANELGRALLSLMRSLTDIMEEETAALKTKDIRNVEDLSRKKTQLVYDCQKTFVKLSRDPDLLKRADPKLREELNAARKLCQVSAQRNESSLKGVLTATRTLVETIVKAAIDKTKRLDSYNDPRKKHLERGGRNSVCDPVAFSRTV